MNDVKVRTWAVEWSAQIINMEVISINTRNSAHLRPGSERLARARLTASYRVYRSWLQSISACTVTSYRIEHVQAPHSCRLELNILSKSRPGLFYPTFRRSDSKVIVGMDFEDLSEGLRIGLFVLNLHAED